LANEQAVWRIMTDWNIQARAHACQNCARPFADREPYHTLLFDVREEYNRLDVCEPCWQTQFSQGAQDRKGFVSHWQGTYAAPTPVPEPIGRETAESLLRKLMELRDPAHTATCYILAVMLERKRLFKIKDQIVQDGKRVFIYEQAKTGDVFTIEDPRLQLNQLDQVQHDVAHLLEHGVESPLAPGTANGVPLSEGPAPESIPAPDAETAPTSSVPVGPETTPAAAPT
jgi:hypothetical protein